VPTRVENNRVHVGERFSVSFQRTDRVAEGNLRVRPVSRGQLPVRLATTLSETFDRLDGTATVVVPCDQREAVWLGFCGENSRRVALKIRQGEVNAVTGRAWGDALQTPQDYLVPPDQTSWYGIASGDGQIRFFSMDTIELLVYEPKEPVDPPTQRSNWNREFLSVDENQLQPGPQIFEVVPDLHGVQFWSNEPTDRVLVCFVDSERWKLLTGETLPSRISGYRGTLLP